MQFGAVAGIDRARGEKRGIIRAAARMCAPVRRLLRHIAAGIEYTPVSLYTAPPIATQNAEPAQRVTLATMTTPQAPTAERYSPSVENLRSLIWIRSIALLGQTGVLAYVVIFSRTTESPWGLAMALVAFAAVTLLSLWRTTRPWPVSDGEFLLQLFVDVLGWAALMYFSGGANNPFVSYLIVPLVIAAAVLSWASAWLVTAACLLAYSGLVYFYQPFPLFTPHAAMGHGDAGQVHVLGMWFNFLFSAGLITFFVIRMAAQLRRREARTVARKEDKLRNEQIIAVAGLAAGTAHELGTPLGTMTLLVDEMLADPELGDQTRKDCEGVKKQLDQCRGILANLTATARLSSVEEKQRFDLEDYLHQVIDTWAVRRPDIAHDLLLVGTGNCPQIAVDPTLAQAIENLLNNAANSGSERVELGADWNSESIILTVRDWGSGISTDRLEQLGKPEVVTSKTGLGLGLLLSHATVERYGGRIAVRNHPEGGAVATLVLPRIALSPEQGEHPAS